MLVFRDGRRRLAVRPLLEQLTLACRDAAVRPGKALPALLRAGELECGLTDANSAVAARIAALTDAASEALVSSRAMSPAPLAGLANLPELPDHINISVPEGFAYYALHPLDYARVLDELALPRRVLVVGIRSIGTTLSAVVRAALAARGVAASRMTVRPVGHPWARETHFREGERRRIEAERAAGAHFLVVDEGPGLSGSSFLSVAEALVGAGVPQSDITLIGSHEVDAARMCARDAAARWACFRFVATAPFVTPAGAVELSGGAWRAELPEAEWPAAWTQFERRKFRLGETLCKFEGLGHYGDAVRDRARRLAELGFSPGVRGEQDGFTAYEFVNGQPLVAKDADEAMLRRMAEYCAVRAREFPAENIDTTALRQLVQVNWREAFGGEVAAPALPVERPVIVDGRTQPHEWLRAPDGRIVKTDAAEHGDDHFSPGPTDIAWDLAGAIVEWGLDSAGAAFLLGDYLRLSGDDAQRRIADYRLAYTLFRLGYCTMAAEATRGSDEEARLRRDAARYRALLSPAKAGSRSKVAA